MVGKRVTESFAMLMIGDGLLTVLEPRRHTRLWKGGPHAWQATMEAFAEHPQMSRLAGAAEIVLGVWLATCQSGRRLE